MFLCALIAVSLAGTASAQIVSGGGADDVFSVIPDASAVVVITNDYAAAVAELDAFLKASVPDAVSLTGSSADAVLPLSKTLPAVRKDVAGLAAAPADGIRTKGMAAAAFIVWPPDKSAWLLIRQVDEAAWLKAHAGKRTESAAGVVTVRGERPFSCVIERGFLIAARDASTIDAYNRMKAKPLARDRAGVMQLSLTAKKWAANISTPTLRAVYGSSSAAAPAIAEALDSLPSCAPVGLDTTPVPSTVFAQLLSDLIANTGEIYLAADVTPEGVKLSGNLNLPAAGLYRLMLAEQKGSAPDVAALASPRPVVALGVSLQGPLFWEYAKGYPPKFVAGLPSGGGAASLDVWTAAADSLREKVGLDNAALIWNGMGEGRCPSPVLVAQAADGEAAVDAVSRVIKSLYGDAALRKHCGAMGLILQQPVVETAVVQERSVTTVTIPFTMSAEEPAKVAKIRQTLGSQLVWRVTAASLGPRQVVVAGDFPTVDALLKFVDTLQPSAFGASGGKAPLEGVPGPAARGCAARQRFAQTVRQKGRHVGRAFDRQAHNLRSRRGCRRPEPRGGRSGGAGTLCVQRDEGVCRRSGRGRGQRRSRQGGEEEKSGKRDGHDEEEAPREESDGLPSPWRRR